MALPGFNAATSLYKTSFHYRLMGASVQANGIVPQLCGPCFLDNTGACVQDCTFTFCVPLGRFGRRCFTYTLTEPCNPSACPPPQVDCQKARNACTAAGGIIFDCSGLEPDGCNACPPCCFRCT